MPNCRALKNDFAHCTHIVANDGDMCGTHANQHARRVERSGPHVAGRCEAYFQTTHRWCGSNALPGQRLCDQHSRARDNVLARDRERDEDRAITNQYFNEQPRPNWQQVVDRIVQDNTRTEVRQYDIAFRYFSRVGDIRRMPLFNAYWVWVINGRFGPAPVENPEWGGDPAAMPVLRPRARELGNLANDAQNVHTAPVTEQTNAGLDKILKAPVPKSQDTQRILTHEWLFNLQVRVKPPFNTYLKVVNDINKWFSTKTCRTNGDRLYYHALRGTVALINCMPNETRAELFQRLWEECLEAVDMCCDGHITRLCNVFVGFDEAFAPPVPFGEILQNKMAAIAGLDIDEEEKKRQATAFFEEYAVPQVERVAWLEAF